MNNFKDFTANVKHFARTIDFKKNSNILASVDVSLYNEYLLLLKLGAEMIPAKLGLDEIFKMSTTTSNTPEELVKLITWARKVNYIIDESKFNKKRK